MSSQASNTGPTPAPVPSGGVALPIPPQDRQAYFDNSIWYTLALWPALTVAVQNSFGGPDSADKRDWFAGAVSDLFTTHPHTDHDDLVVFLLQVMQDEFDVNVEDDSEEEVAGRIVGLRKKVLGEGDMGVFKELEGRWKSKGKMKIDIEVIEGENAGDDVDWSDEEDVEMEGMDEDRAPQLVEVKEKKEKVLPQIDEDGFETVVSKKKR